MMVQPTASTQKPPHELEISVYGDDTMFLNPIDRLEAVLWSYHVAWQNP